MSLADLNFKGFKPTLNQVSMGVKENALCDSRYGITDQQICAGDGFIVEGEEVHDACQVRT